MASESCPICGDEADADEDDPHGHFDTNDDPCEVCGEPEDEHDDSDHEYES